MNKASNNRTSRTKKSQEEVPFSKTHSNSSLPKGHNPRKRKRVRKSQKHTMITSAPIHLTSVPDCQQTVQAIEEQQATAQPPKAKGIRKRKRTRKSQKHAGISSAFNQVTAVPRPQQMPQTMGDQHSPGRTILIDKIPYFKSIKLAKDFLYQQSELPAR